MTTYNCDKHHRRSIRLPGYDYSSPGGYFVTICVRGGECLLGDIVDGTMELNDCGQIAAESWLWLGERYPYVVLDHWVVMPNHLHGIVVIQGDDGDDARKGGSPRGGSRKGGSRTAPTPAAPTPAASAAKIKPLGRLVGAFKTVSTKRINVIQGTPGVPFWQRDYWEHIIRDDGSLQRIREYIENNPARWEMDQLHPDAPPNPFNQEER
jgi:REP element-mobilizing transposase RayT